MNNRNNRAMEYKLLSVSKCSKLVGINIGDYIQALASSQYYPQVDGFLDRDEDLKNYHGPKCKIIMNGWFMHNPLNWPPSNNIIPLFVAFHINSLAKSPLLSDTSLAYLKKHQPIGCRDITTVNLLKEHNIDAYFSGCMTLTLGKKFHSDFKDNSTYIVDPIYDGNVNVKNCIIAAKEFIIHPIDILNLFKIKQLRIHYGHNPFMRLLKICLYYKEYTKLFSREIIMNSTYICQESNYFKERFKTDEERLDEAKRLVELYAKAKFVITSRIHCALPCLGLETPVIYINKINDREASKCRLEGLIDLFNVIDIKDGKLKPQFEIKDIISSKYIPQNKHTWEQYAELLNKVCSDFTSKN